MDYATLVGNKRTEGSIRNWANNDLAPAGTVLEEAQAFIYQRFRVREMRSDDTDLPLATGVLALALPSDFLDPIAIFDQFQHRITLKNERDVQGYRSKDSSGAWVRGTMPTVYAIYGEKFQFDMPPSADLTLNLVYFQRPALLSSSNATNFLTRRYPHLLRKACMIGVWEFLARQDAKQAAIQECLALMGSIMADDDMSRRGEDADADYQRANMG